MILSSFGVSPLLILRSGISAELSFIARHCRVDYWLNASRYRDGCCSSISIAIGTVSTLVPEAPCSDCSPARTRKADMVELDAGAVY